MSRISPETKVNYMILYEEGKISQSQIAKELGISHNAVYQWISIYKSLGLSAFTSKKNNIYSAELKHSAVMDYLNGVGSQQFLCQKYGIRSKTQLQRWIMKYNSHKELKSSSKGGSRIMTKGRKTTINERIDIVNHCIASNHNYQETSQKYNISYQQARNYTLKYEEHGLEGLKDRRGRRKPVCEMNELEKLRAENKLLKAQKARAEMEISFLKKLDEIQRRED